jgi:hypothetical protein
MNNNYQTGGKFSATHQIEGFPFGIHGVAILRQICRSVAADTVLVVAHVAVQPGI